MNRILVIDDDTFICNILEKLLTDDGFKVDTAFSASSADKYLKKTNYDLVICDFRLPDSDGIKMLEKIKGHNPEISVVIITAYADVRIAVKLMKLGASDYVTKPLQQNELLEIVNKTISRKTNDRRETFPDESFIFGRSQAIKNVMQLAETVAPTDLAVIIEGETGSGKEYIARYIHANSPRKTHPFIALDCGAIPKDLANSELFGHIKGSFTGAIKDKTGVFEEAHGGTLFLDEIGNLTYDIQVKLLRSLQEKSITRLGDTRAKHVDVRIIAATNENLLDEVESNNFREDLYHRLNEFKIHLPPLRDRTDDIILFAEYFISMANVRLNKKILGIDEKLVHILKKYPWYGNLRELRNVINRAVLMSTNSYIDFSCLPGDIIHHEKHDEAELVESFTENGTNRLKDASNEFEKQLIINTLKDTNFNKSKAARLLKIDRKTLYNKIKQYDINI